MKDNSNLENNKEEKKNSGVIKTEEIYRVTVTKSADEALEIIVNRVNDGFEAGRVNRSEAISWILTYISKNLTDALIQEFRMDHFDEMTLLESMFKKAKKSGKIPSELKGLLLRQSGLDASNNKKTRDKPNPRLTSSFINDETQVKPENAE
jgi:hypothetical protein